MDSNGNISSSSLDNNSESIHSIPSTKELLKCSRESCNNRVKPKKARTQNVVFSDQVQHQLPANTDVKQIAQSLGHLMDMMSRARMSKKPKISLTIRPRKTSLSQESDVTAVDAQSEATRKKKTPVKEMHQPDGKLLGGRGSNSNSNSTILPMFSNNARNRLPKTPSNMKLNRAKSFENLTHKRQPIQQISCRLTDSLKKNANNNMPSDNRPFKLNQRTNEFICQYLRSRGQSLKSPSSIASKSSVKTVRPFSTTAAGPTIARH